MPLCTYESVQEGLDANCHLIPDLRPGIKESDLQLAKSQALSIQLTGWAPALHSTTARPAFHTALLFDLACQMFWFVRACTLGQENCC